MDAAASAPPVSASSRWVARARLACGVAIVWAALHFIADRFLLDRGIRSPAFLLIGDARLLSGQALSAVVLLFAAAIGARVAGAAGGLRTLLVASCGMALWAFSGGVMDDWLALRRPVPAPPQGATFAPLLIEYAALLAVVAFLYRLGAMLDHRATGASWRGCVRSAFAVEPPAAPAAGWMALLIAAVIGAAGLMLLSGPASGPTFRGQVWFAVGVGAYAGTVLGRQFTHVSAPGWYLVAPILTGAAGVLLAMLRPTPGAPYQALDLLPPTHLVRPIPIEMVSVGVIAVYWALRPEAHRSHPAQPAPA